MGDAAMSPQKNLLQKVMRTLLIAILCLACSGASAQQQLTPEQPKLAYNFNCGIQPIAPMGCTVGDCVCDQSGIHCQWQFVCSNSNISPNAFSAQPQNYGPPAVDFSPLGQAATNLGQKLHSLLFREGRGSPQRQDAPRTPGADLSDPSNWPPDLIKAIKAWYRCLASSMQVQKKRFMDKNQAVETAFSACETEERALRHGLIVDLNVTIETVETVIDGNVKPSVKEEMLKRAAE
jgi:hypothetical protein